VDDARLVSWGWVQVLYAFRKLLHEEFSLF
jgi:hypothetical protein